MVRTLTKEDVNITDAESLFDAGALDQQGNGNQPAQPVTREPVFKLVWASFPDRLTLSTLGAIEQNLEPVEPSTKQYAEREETILVVLGGCLSNERPAINCLQMPVYQAPPTLKVTPLSPSEGLSITTRKAFRESLTVTGVSKYPTQTPAEDFVLIPRSSPYFNLSYDPIALVTFLTPDEKLAQPNALHAKRSVEAWSFPPPRSGLPPEDTGRKNFHTTTDEALSGFAIAAVPTLLNDTRPRLTTSESTASWRLPWSPSPASPGMSAFDSMRDLSLPSKPTRPLRLPSIFWTGATNALGCEIYSLDNPTFRRLIAFGIENSGSEAKPRLPLRGGLAVPDLHSTNAPEVAQVKMENYRIMATWHADGAIR
jgi:syntaxin-binding protein 5